MNDLAERLRELRNRISSQLESIKTEEAAKNAIIMPFLAALGYDVFNPGEVVPELVADVGMKKGEKVDYAVKRDGKIVMLIECKWSGRDLSVENASQLFRYFTVTEARFAILTNGLVYKFYTDIDAPNKMDASPFFTFDLNEFEDGHVEELRKFTKQSFDVEAILGSAARLKYSQQIKQMMAAELAKPSEDLVRLFASRIYGGRLTSAVREEFQELLKSSLNEFIRERVSDRLKSALRAEDQTPPIPSVLDSATALAQDATAADDAIETTAMELEAFAIIKAVLRRHVDANRIHLRDAKTYAAVLLDDNNRRPIARLWFNARSKRYIGTFVGKDETRHELARLNDLYSHEDALVAQLRRLVGEAKAEPA